MQVDFSSPPGPEWNRYIGPNSRIDNTGTTWLFVNDPLSERRYTDAQLDDYQGLRRRNFLWRPPLTMTVRARFSHPADEMIGTAGFGFWNDPFLMTGLRMPALPRALWFFSASPHSNMKLDLDTPGHGWKAATIDAIRLPFFLLAPTAPVAVPLMNIKSLYRALWPIGQRAIGVNEVLIDAPMTDWHTYQIDWGKHQAHFMIDGETILDCDTPPCGPLGFVMWIDNQAMVITPWGKIGHKSMPLPRQQWMEVDRLEIIPR